MCLSSKDHRFSCYSLTSYGSNLTEGIILVEEMGRGFETQLLVLILVMKYSIHNTRTLCYWSYISSLHKMHTLGSECASLFYGFSVPPSTSQSPSHGQYV